MTLHGQIFGQYNYRERILDFIWIIVFNLPRAIDRIILTREKQTSSNLPILDMC